MWGWLRSELLFAVCPGLAVFAGGGEAGRGTFPPQTTAHSGSKPYVGLVALRAVVFGVPGPAVFAGGGEGALCTFPLQNNRGYSREELIPRRRGVSLNLALSCPVSTAERDGTWLNGSRVKARPSRSARERS